MVAERNNSPTIDVGPIADLDITISDLGPIIDLVRKPEMAELYLRALDGVVTVPELLEEVELTKSTVYDYVEALQNAGLVTEAGRKGGATAYDANEFTFTLEIEDAEIEVTPELVEVVAHRDTHPEIGAFVDQHGLATLAEFVDLAYEQARGNVTTRMIADLLDIPRGSTYDMLERVHSILDIGDEPETYSVDGISGDERQELLDRSP